jgi:hypothetical protein
MFADAGTLEDALDKVLDPREGWGVVEGASEALLAFLDLLPGLPD